MSPSHDLRQPTVRVPLASSSMERVNELGVIALRCRLSLSIEARPGLPNVLLPFVFDSGASYSLMDIEVAEHHKLPVPSAGSEAEILLHTARGRQAFRVRPGRLRLWWDERCLGYPFDWPVLFRMDAPFGAPAVIGLGGVVKTCRWTFDGTYTTAAPYGHLTLDDTR